MGEIWEVLYIKNFAISQPCDHYVKNTCMNNRLLVVNASWLMAQGSRLMAGGPAAPPAVTHEPLTIPDGLMDKGIIKPTQKQIKTN